MTDSPASRFLPWVVLASFALVFASMAFPAHAQQDKPILLTPPKKLAPPSESSQGAAPDPANVQPGSASTITSDAKPNALPVPPGAEAAAKDAAQSAGKVTTQAAVQSAPQTTIEGVQVGNLQNIDPDTAGTLTIEQGGFGTDMWLGTSREIVERLLPQLPVSTSSATMRNLMRRLLLSIARVPDGKSSGLSLVATRIKLLAAMGDLVAVNTLLNVTPGRAEDSGLARIETETRFLSNDNARACALAGGQIKDQNDPFWQKAFFFCQALAGEHNKAALGISVMRETGDQDEVYFSLIDSLAAGTPPTLVTLANPTALHLAMARVAKAKLPDDVISSNRPGILRTIAISPNAPVELRLESAERAEASGALPVDSLRQLYSSVSFSGEDLSNPLSRAETEGGPMTRALLYHSSLTQTVPTAQAEVVAKALSLGRKEGRYASVVRVFLPVLKSIPPSAELLWFAPEAVRGLLLVGDTLSAEAWFALMRASALFNKDASKGISRLMPVARLMGSSEAAEWNTARLSSWWETVKDDKGAVADAALLYSLFDALGEPVPTENWKTLVSGKDRKAFFMPDPALWFRLIEATEAVRQADPETKMASSSESASDAGTDEINVAPAKVSTRKAETILLSLLALGEDGPAGANPILIRQVILSIRAAGFDKEARAIAVEAALAAGL